MIHKDGTPSSALVLAQYASRLDEANDSKNSKQRGNNEQVGERT